MPKHRTASLDYANTPRPSKYADLPSILATRPQAIVALFEKKKMRPVLLSGGATKMVLTGSRVLSGSAVLVPIGFPPGYPNYKAPEP